jgi:hypothetical protein
MGFTGWVPREAHLRKKTEKNGAQEMAGAQIQILSPRIEQQFKRK